MLIGVDIDGVLYPFEDAANEAVAQRFGIPNPGPWTCWNYLKDTVPAEAWDWLWSAEGQDAAFGRVELVYPGVVEAIGALLKAGHSLHFVTHRDPRRTAGHTAAFLTRHFGRHPWAGVHVTRSSVRKARLMPWDVFVDDKPDTVYDLKTTTDAMVFAPARPWNEELAELETWGRFIRYTDPATIAKWVEARS